MGDIRFVQEMKTSIVEDIFIKQGIQGCNQIYKCFRNPNNHKIKIDRRSKEWEWENIFKRPIQISKDKQAPVWQEDRDLEWSLIHKSNLPYQTKTTIPKQLPYHIIPNQT